MQMCTRGELWKQSQPEFQICILPLKVHTQLASIEFIHDFFSILMPAGEWTLIWQLIQINCRLLLWVIWAEQGVYATMYTCRYVRTCSSLFFHFSNYRECNAWNIENFLAATHIICTLYSKVTFKKCDIVPYRLSILKYWSPYSYIHTYIIFD